MEQYTTPETYFDKSCSVASEGWQASLWTSEEEQFYRYAVMAKFINWNGCSVLDVGCGQGDLMKYIKDRSKAVTYTGVDVSQEMIKTAKTRFPDGDFIHADFLADSFQPKPHDFVFGIGTFCLRTDNQLDYLKKSIEKLFKLSRRCLGINLCSVRSTQVDRNGSISTQSCMRTSK